MNLFFSSSLTQELSPQVQEIVFVDASVDQAHLLLAGLKPSAIAIHLNAQGDGIVEIAQHLSQFPAVSAIHLLAHGAPGEIFLGSTRVNLSVLSVYRDWLAQIGAGLVGAREILLYGCECGAGAVGESFVATLAQVTGAKIAASASLTGNAALGGRWNLVMRTAALQTALAFSPEVRAAYPGVLGNFVVTNAANSGSGSLRDAITQANANSDTSIITFNLPSDSRILLQSNLPDITTNLTINGDFGNDGIADIIISGEGNSSPFFIRSGATVVIEGINIESASETAGGAIFGQSSANITFRDGEIRNSQATGGSGTFGGGAIAIVNAGTQLTLENARLINNTSSQPGGGISAQAGTTLTLRNSTILGNTSNQQGGGLYLNDATATIINTTIAGNTIGTGVGAGINLTNGTASSAIGNISLQNSLVVDNFAGNAEDNFQLVGSPASTNNAQFSITDSTNNVQFVDLASGDVRLVLVANVGDDGIDDGNNTLVPTGLTADILGNPRIIDNNSDGTATVNLGAVETIALANQPPTISAIADLTLNAGASSGSIPFTISDLETAAGSLLVSTASSNTSLIPAGSISVGGSGSNRTISLTPQAGQSGTATITVAVDDGTTTTEEAFTVNVVDTQPSNLVVVNTLAGGTDTDPATTTLREALQQVTSGGTITFANNLLGGTISLSGGQLLINRSVAIDGDLNNDGMPDITVRAAANSRVIEVNDNSDSEITVNLEGLTITGGSVVGDGGGILSLENLNITNSTITDNTVISSGNGGGIFHIGTNGGTLSLDNSTVSNNRTLNNNNGSGNGAGLGLTQTTALRITNSVITGNSSRRNGGGLFIGLSESISAYLGNSTIAANTGGNGGGIQIGSSRFANLNILNTTVSANSARSQGGGLQISVRDGSVALTNSTIHGNTANSDGGALRITDGTANLVSSTVTGNRATTASGTGGIRTLQAGTVSLTNSIVATNTTGGAATDLAGQSVDGGFNFIGNGNGTIFTKRQQ
ncbi:MAG: DUF4347 domain-containing protein [Chloroflexaceae bacterium]|nr:DUF4347 domain-containing protein [Chloroflexaceae bacterium]